MTDWYTPEPFSSPFPAEFDPRDELVEVVGVTPQGGLKVVSSRGEYQTVAPEGVAKDTPIAIGARLSWTVGTKAEGKPSVFKRLFGSKTSEVAPTRVVTPLRPNELERVFCVNWLVALGKAGLNVQGVSIDDLLIERLRSLPFGSRALHPLRRTLRQLLESLVGRFPARDDSWGADDVPQMAHDLLVTLSVKNFAAPSTGRVKNRWSALEPVADAANVALEQSRSPLRLISCERETFPADPLGEGRDYLAELPVWLIATPSTAVALESANILRRYRGARFPMAAVGDDPRILKPALVEGTSTAPVVPLRPSGPPTQSTFAATDATFDENPANAGPPRVPCKATVRSFVPMDGTGELVTDDGIVVRFGRSACKGFDPAVGLAVWLIEAAPHPLGRGFRAKVLNVTGKIESDRMADIEAANRAEEARNQREVQLLKRFGLEEDDRGYWKALLTLSADDRLRLATELVTLKRESHLFDRLFEDLTIIAPEAFHPHLEYIDWRVEPESLAWTNAPFNKMGFALEVLGKGAALQLRTRLEIGTVGPAGELARRQRSAANDIGAAILALARSASTQAIETIESWAKVSGTSVEELNSLLVVVGWQHQSGKLHRLWGDAHASKMVRDNVGAIELLGTSDKMCPACKTPLTRLVGGDIRGVVAFPLFTCASCTVADFEPYLVEVSANGEPTPIFAQPIPDDFEPTFLREAPFPVLRVRAEDAPLSIPHDVDDFDEAARAGGVPSWVQSPVHAGHCPKCSGLLHFTAQIPDPPGGDLWGGDTGMLYVFSCAACRVSATIVQNC